MNDPVFWWFIHELFQTVAMAGMLFWLIRLGSRLDRLQKGLWHEIDDLQHKEAEPWDS